MLTKYNGISTDLTENRREIYVLVPVSEVVGGPSCYRPYFPLSITTLKAGNASASLFAYH